MLLKVLPAVLMSASIAIGSPIVVPYCVTTDGDAPPANTDKAAWSVFYQTPEGVEEKDAHRDGHLGVDPDGRCKFYVWVRIPAGTVLVDTGDFGAFTRGALEVESIISVKKAVECCDKKGWIERSLVQRAENGVPGIVLSGGFRHVKDQQVADDPAANTKRWVKLAVINARFWPVGQPGSLELQFPVFPSIRDASGRDFTLGARYQQNVHYVLAIGGHTWLARKRDTLGPDIAHRNGAANDPDVRVVEGTTIVEVPTPSETTGTAFGMPHD